MLHIALLYIVSSNFPAEAEKPYREAASVLIRPILHLMRIKQHTCHSVMSWLDDESRDHQGIKMALLHVGVQDSSAAHAQTPSFTHSLTHSI